MILNRFPDPRTVATDQSMAGDVTSSSVNIQRTYEFAFQFVWSAGSTPVGTVTLQYSNDGTNWDTDEDSELDVSGNTGSHTIEKIGTGPKWVRAKYTRTSGSGTLNITICEKGWH